MKKTILLLCAICFCISVSAQGGPQLAGKNVEVCYPKVFMEHIIQESTAREVLKSGKYGQTSDTKRYWIAYSDRSDNKLYTSANSRSPICGTLGFNEKVRIAKIVNGYALVYVEPREGVPYPTISHEVKKTGYVNMNNLLLWHTCPTNEHNIYNKALLCVNLDQKSSDVGLLYYNPAGGSDTKKLTTDMYFYFIMKREGNKSLLALQHSMDGSVDKVLVGWVAEGSYVPWNQRTCLERTWDRRDVEAFEKLKASYKIYHEDDPQMKGNPALIEDFTTKNARGNGIFQYRMEPNMLRFPILSTLKTARGDTVYKCSTFGVTGEGKKNVLSELEKNSDPNYQINKTLKDLTNIDIAIVIDGTRSMGPYFQAVKQAVKNAEEYFESNKYKIRVGMVIYRDYSDGKGNDVEIYPFTSSKNPNLMKFLDNGGESGYGFKSSSRDRTLEEALYLGIDTALEQLEFNTEHTNLMLVVGDCGNDRNDNRFDRDEIVNKIVDKNVNIMGFQVNNGKEEAYATFNYQMQYLMKNSLNSKYKSLGQTKDVKWGQLQDGIKFENSDGNNIYVGAHYNPLKGNALEISKLTSLIGEAINYCKESMTTQSEIVYNFGFGGNNAVKASKIDEEFVKQKIGEENFKRVKEGNNLLAFRGFTAKKIEGRNAYKPILFISSQELEALLNQLEGVNLATAETNDRGPYVNAMKALVVSLSPGLSEEEIKNMENGKIMQMVEGLNEPPASLLSKYTLNDIESTVKVKHSEFYTLVTKFSQKYEKLKRLKSRQYEYTYRANNLVYYWLPIEDLP